MRDMNLLDYRKICFGCCVRKGISQTYLAPPSPCIKSTQCFRVVCIRRSNIRHKKIIRGGYCFILFVLNVIYFGIMLPTFLLYTVLGLKYIGKPFTARNSL